MTSFSYRSPPAFLEKYLKEWLELPDLSSLALFLGLKEGEAEKVVIKHNEDTTGYKIRDVFCTKETRELRREILEMLSHYAVTRTGKDKLLTLTPLQDREELQRRFDDVRMAIELLQAIGDRVTELRDRLKRAVIPRLNIPKAPVLAVKTGDKDVEQLIRAAYGDFVALELIDSSAKPEELVSGENCVLVVCEQEQAYDEAGIIPRHIADLSDPCEIYPEFVVRSYVVMQAAIETLIEILEQFEAVKDSMLFKDVSIADLKAVMALIREAKEEQRVDKLSFDEVILKYEDKINKEAARIVRTGGGTDEFKSYLEEVLVEMAGELMLRDDTLLRESAYAGLESGMAYFEFARDRIEGLRRRYMREMCERRYYRLRELAKQMEQYHDSISEGIKKLFYLDSMIAIALFARDFELNIPELVEGGLGVEEARNIFLKDEERKGGAKVVPVSYSVGDVKLGIFGATPHPIAILTGANSGGKTCLLNTLATCVILAELGLPVPAARAEIPVVPVYLYRRKMIKKTGSFEYSIRALSRVFMREGSKVVLIDELEALTEPGAMGRIMASILNNLREDTLAVVITHLINEILPYISKRKVRVDGIEPEGLDDSGNIIVDRQPMFNHIGSSMPELVIKKLLARAKRAELRAVYEDILTVLTKERGKWA